MIQKIRREAFDTDRVTVHRTRHTFNPKRGAPMEAPRSRRLLVFFFPRSFAIAQGATARSRLSLSTHVEAVDASDVCGKT